MVRAPVPPNYHEPRFNCALCGAFAAQAWRELTYRSWQDEQGTVTHEPVRDLAGGPLHKPASRRAEWDASLCAACEDHSLWINGQLTYPGNRSGLAVPEPAEDMPREVEDLYREAAAVLPHSRRAAAALCRASLERLAKVLTPEEPARATLDERLIALHSKTTDALARGLQVIRHAGNTALHGARDDDESVVIYMGGDETDVIDLFFITINELVVELVSRPARLQAAYALLPEQKRVAIERRINSNRSNHQTETS